MRILSEADVMGLLTPEMAIRSAEEAYAAFSGGLALVPPRAEIHRTGPAGTALFMAGLVGDALGVKMVGSVASAEDPSRRHTGCLTLLWDAADLRPRALLSADVLNDHRTAAGLAVGTRLLASPDAATHALFGTGKLSFPSAVYIARVRPIRRLILVGRTRAKVDDLAARLRADPAMSGVELVTDLGPDEAVSAADIVTTVTRSATPLFDGRRLRPGTHVNLAGAMRRHEREMDDEAASRGRFYVDSREATLERAGDLVLALESGALDASRIVGEIGSLILGRIPGRQDPADITVFRAMGIAAQDLCLAKALADAAEARQIGTPVAI